MKSRTKTPEISLRHVTPKIVNATAPVILNKIYTHSFHGYTLFIKQYIIQSYETECTINNCYVCNL